MELRFEFLTVFREKAGAESLILRLEDTDGGKPTVLEAVEALERSLGDGALGLLDGKGIRAGVLLFLKCKEGGLERVLRAGEHPVDEGHCLVLSAAMEGG